MSSPISTKFLLLLFCLLTLDSPLMADTLTVDTWRGRKVLRLSGPIEEGISVQFAELATKVEKFPHGMPVLLLDSPGGSVAEAMTMSRLLDLHSFHTVIPNGAKCASACASILFIAGAFRTVEPFGALGQHSCSSGGMADKACNEMLAQHALAHGVSHGSVAAFVTYVPPGEIQWFSRKDADGWGLTRYAGEKESGFEKSEPSVIKIITGRTPSAQAAWRIDFREDGFKAFLRPVTDAERELQLNLFCSEKLNGRLFISMEIHGPKDTLANAVIGLRVKTDLSGWDDYSPVIWQADDLVSEVITEVPRDQITSVLAKANSLTYIIAMKEPYKPIHAQTRLRSSRQVLRFASNHCPSGRYEGPVAPLH
jgi:hypothetical protein